MDKGNINDITELFWNWTGRWHEDEDLLALIDDRLLQLLIDLHRQNYLLWHQEDIARRGDIESTAIAQVKKAVDKLNQKRNDLIEVIDEWLFNNKYAQLVNMDLPLRTETPGSVFDRLSILALKIYHMQEQTERTDIDQLHIDLCCYKLGILKQQRSDLANSLLDMIRDLDNNIIRMKIYRQFKMYNDPDLNPELYKSKLASDPNDK